MRGGKIAAALVAIVLLAASSAVADIAFPARLDVAESEKGVYTITFTLPIIEGRKLRAEPLMPPTCVETSSRESGFSAGGLTTIWSVRCEPASLAGEAILVEGLLGGQTDLAFSLTTLDGRSYSQILRPSRPGFLVPEPPSPAALAGAAALEGARRVLSHVSLWLLLAVAALLGAPGREQAKAAGAFAIGLFAAQWLGGRGWLEVAPQTRDILIWVTIAIPSIRLAGGGDGWKDWVRPLWPATVLLGLLFGAAQPEALPIEGLSNTEQLVALVLFAVGAGTAMLLMSAAAGELRAVFDLAGGGRFREPATRVFGTGAGALSTGVVLASVVGLAMGAGGGPRAPLELILLVLVLAPSFALAGIGRGPAMAAFVVLAAAGVTPGLLGIHLPVPGLLVLGSLVVLGSALAANRSLPGRWAQLVAAVAVPAAAWGAAEALVADVSRATAVTTGVVLVAVCGFFGALAVTQDLRSGGLKPPARLFGGGVAVLALFWRLAEYRQWFDREVATEAALGLARVPLLALGLVILAVVLWPRRRRVAQELGMQRAARGWHWMLLGAAFLVLPYGTVLVPNPFFEPHAPQGEDARRVVSRVLSDTYHAFNIADEGELFDTLAASVTGDLVDDLYLDGRRRLTAGTREGTQVTVRDVGVLEISDPFGGATAEEGISYDCRWAVVARVQHLQHVHHRQNIYNGVLTLQSEGGRWKIAGVELLSEDRVVVPWKPT